MDKILDYLRTYVRIGQDEKYFVTARILTHTVKMVSSLENMFYTKTTTLDATIMKGHIEIATANTLIMLSTYDRDYSSVIPKTTKTDSIGKEVLMQSFTTIMHDTTTLLDQMKDGAEDEYQINILLSILEAFSELYVMIGIPINIMYDNLYDKRSYYFVVSNPPPKELKPGIEKLKKITELDIELHPDHSYKKIIIKSDKTTKTEFSGEGIITDFFHAVTSLKKTKTKYYYSVELYEFISSEKFLQNAYIAEGTLHTSEHILQKYKEYEYDDNITHVLISTEMNTLDDLLDHINEK